MEFNLKTGLRGEITEQVRENNTARRFGSGSIDVYATPAMIGLMEKAALSAVDPLLPEGFATVGIDLAVQHLAATPLGMTVKAKAELTELDGRRLVFRVEAADEVEKIGEGQHQRFIIQVDKFLEKSARKGAKRE
ncbi:thioesterase family protein [Candidatus Formimonas warabiya]|uniref:Thioesterase n=1 Tax=Formimonas warabiya TaxID=1761012 RepID=A0A3G1KXC1_FORW1|nr:thioesterase family protein [Candidatus Formimonas warabiya]ATW27019.1 thioesterase [Candidatus Formimonas warabiya]